MDTKKPTVFEHLEGLKCIRCKRVFMSGACVVWGGERPQPFVFTCDDCDGTTDARKLKERQDEASKYGF